MNGLTSEWSNTCKLFSLNVIQFRMSNKISGFYFAIWMLLNFESIPNVCWLIILHLVIFIFIMLHLEYQRNVCYLPIMYFVICLTDTSFWITNKHFLLHVVTFRGCPLFFYILRISFLYSLYFTYSTSTFYLFFIFSTFLLCVSRKLCRDSIDPFPAMTESTPSFLTAVTWLDRALCTQRSLFWILIKRAKSGLSFGT